MQGAIDFIATEYRLAGSQITVQERGRGRWAVCNGNMVLDNEDRWGHEPMPSSRTDEWLALNRFDDLDAAFAAARRVHRLNIDELRKLNERA